MLSEDLMGVQILIDSETTNYMRRVMCVALQILSFCVSRVSRKRFIDFFLSVHLTRFSAVLKN